MMETNIDSPINTSECTSEVLLYINVIPFGNLRIIKFEVDHTLCSK